MTASYDLIARFYDAIEGERPETVDLLRRLLGRYHPRAESVLELACGTGTILRGLPEALRREGLDASAAMLELARRKVPGARLHLGDMSGFALDRTFDVVLCIFNSINHLVRPAQWRGTFESARRHCNRAGVLIFDINTPRYMEMRSQAPSECATFEGNTLISQVRSVDEGLYEWTIRVFEPAADGRLVQHAQTVREAAFPVAAVEAMLSPWFAIEARLDGRGAPADDATGTVYFVCRAKDL